MIDKLKQYQNAIDESNIVSKTDINGVITFANDEFCKISGYSREELIGSSHNIVRHPDVSKSVFKKLWDTILAKKVYKGIIKNRAKDGSAFYLKATIIPILDQNGDIEEFVAIRQDVSEIVKLNEKLLKAQNELENINQNLQKVVDEKTSELKNLNENLKIKVREEIAKNEEKNRLMLRQSRFASMGELVANIAHQWRQPLNELSINLFNLKRNISDEEKFLKIYNDSKFLIQTMSKTIDDFKHFFSADEPSEEFFIYDAMSDTLRMINATFEKKNIKIKLNFPKSDIKILGHRGELSHVFLNILTNAKDAFEGINSSKKIITVNASKDRRHAYIEIENNGSFIEDNVMDKIFEPYFTTKHKLSGTGIGLYMSKLIVKNMGGQIHAKNTENGVKFMINLPLRNNK